MKATSCSSSISANLSNSEEAMVKFTSIRSRNLWQPHFRTFCELVEGEGVFTLQGERHCTYYLQQGGELYR